jgi:hypothetical protein
VQTCFLFSGAQKRERRLHEHKFRNRLLLRVHAHESVSVCVRRVLDSPFLGKLNICVACATHVLFCFASLVFFAWLRICFFDVWLCKLNIGLVDKVAILLFENVFSFVGDN